MRTGCVLSILVLLVLLVLLELLELLPLRPSQNYYQYEADFLVSSLKQRTTRLPEL